jgi:hypothetical protein
MAKLLNIWDEIHELKKTRRTELTELRPRHLEVAARIAHRDDDIAGYHEFLLTNYDRQFGCLRGRKDREVPSDMLRKELIIHRILLRVEKLKAEKAAGIRIY